MGSISLRFLAGQVHKVLLRPGVFAAGDVGGWLDQARCLGRPRGRDDRTVRARVFEAVVIEAAGWSGPWPRVSGVKHRESGQSPRQRNGPEVGPRLPCGSEMLRVPSYGLEHFPAQIEPQAR
jgi:hypothetical protein